MENPDRKLDYLMVKEGSLRYVESDGGRVLQRYEWSHELSRFDWFDVPEIERGTT